MILPALNKSDPDDSDLVASLFGEGSLVMICLIIGVAVLAAIIIFLQKKKDSVNIFQDFFMQQHQKENLKKLSELRN